MVILSNKKIERLLEQTTELNIIQQSVFWLGKQNGITRRHSVAIPSRGFRT